MAKKISPYWLFQAGGWTLYMVIYLFFYFTLTTKRAPYFIESLIIEIFTFLLITHIMRLAIQRKQLLEKSFSEQIAGFLLLTLVFSIFFSIVNNGAIGLLDIVPERAKKLSFLNFVVRTSVGAFLILFMWNSIYIIYHYITRSRKDLVERLRLETMVKEMELNTIKAHINPHFIFNALNSIRALVDEDPQRARSAITQLSNILRSSMQAEKVKMTPLQRELGIIKDYLALEHIRFEQRLAVHYEIDENTLDQPVPPMMLQTLVENAIKHGISKQVAGGHVTVTTLARYGKLIMTVTNTGQFKNDGSSDGGFGLSSTYDRLHLLYGDAAHFTIRNLDAESVEAVVTLPLEPTTPKPVLPTNQILAN